MRIHARSRMARRQAGWPGTPSVWGAMSGHGLTVALLGPDGAGKSTVARSICRRTDLSVRQLYMGLGDRPRPAWTAEVWLWALLDLLRLAVLWLAGQWLRARGFVVLFDRYSYDARITPPDRLGRGERWLRRVRGHLLPAPDLTIVLDAPGTVLHERSGEYTPAVLEAERREYQALRHVVPRVAIVDATLPVAVVEREILALIRERMVRP